MLSSLNAAIAEFTSLLENGFSIHLNFLGQFVKVIIESVGVVGVGVIVFALILKAITTPFDIYQRVKMRKQNLIMQQMKPELEKLQKQYANDKQTYSMKMYELQKKNGYSMLGACLPMIISLVVIIVAVTAFQSYAQDANLSMYERMASSYNASILNYAADGEDFRLSAEETDDPLVIVPETFGSAGEDGARVLEKEGVTYTLVREGDILRMTVEDPASDKFLFYRYALTAGTPDRQYYLNIDKMLAYLDSDIADEERAAEAASMKEGLDLRLADGATQSVACIEVLEEVGAAASAAEFRKNDPGFLWVKNVWYPDVSYKHPIQNYANFTSSFNSGIVTRDGEEGKAIQDVFTPTQYERLTAHLGEEKEQANGYFGMIILSIGLMLLSQFIVMRSQKETNKYQTVDGQGARTQKIMMVMMPIMFAIFGFLWSAAFTIYNIISSAISILVTVITNLILGKVFRKKEEEALKERYTRSVPWKQEPETKRKKRK